MVICIILSIISVGLPFVTLQTPNHNTTVMNNWLTIQDIIGSASDWPRWLRRKFWCSFLHYKDRVEIASFCYTNGCDPRLMCDTLREINPAYNSDIRDRLLALYTYWNHPVLGEDRRSRYFAYNIHYNRVLDLNLNERVTGHPVIAWWNQRSDYDLCGRIE